MLLRGAGRPFQLVVILAWSRGARRALMLGQEYFRKPTVSCTRGPAVALLCDISIASKSSKIIDWHTRLGVAADDQAAII